MASRPEEARKLHPVQLTLDWGKGHRSELHYSNTPLLRFTITCSSSLFFTLNGPRDFLCAEGACKRRSLPHFGDN